MGTRGTCRAKRRLLPKIDSRSDGLLPPSSPPLTVLGLVPHSVVTRESVPPVPFVPPHSSARKGHHQDELGLSQGHVFAASGLADSNERFESSHEAAETLTLNTVMVALPPSSHLVVRSKTEKNKIVCIAACFLVDTQRFVFSDHEVDALSLSALLILRKLGFWRCFLLFCSSNFFLYIF